MDTSQSLFKEVQSLLRSWYSLI